MTKQANISMLLMQTTFAVVSDLLKLTDVIS